MASNYFSDREIVVSKLLRKEVKRLAIDLRGRNHFKKQEIKHQIKQATTGINSCKRKLKAFEKEQGALVAQLNKLIDDETNDQQGQQT